MRTVDKSPQLHKRRSGTPGPSPIPEEFIVLETIWAGGLGKAVERAKQETPWIGNLGKTVERRDTPGHSKPSSPGAHRHKYGAWYMPAGDWRTVYGGSAEDDEAIQRKLGSTSTEELLKRHELDQKRSCLQGELGASYTVKVYREYVKEHHMREPIVMLRIPTNSDQAVLRSHHKLYEGVSDVGREEIRTRAKDKPTDLFATNLATGMNIRLAMDGLRPQDLDIDEIIPPEQREMVRRTVAMVDMLEQHAQRVGTLQRERMVKDAEWAEILRNKQVNSMTDMATRSANRIRSPRMLRSLHDLMLSSRSAPINTFTASQSRSLASPSREAADGPSDGDLCVISGQEHQDHKLAKEIGGEGVSPSNAMFLDDVNSQQHHQHPMSSPVLQSLRVPHISIPSCRYSGAPHNGQSQSRDLELLAERSDVPLGVRYLAVLGEGGRAAAAAAAGIPTPEPASPKVPHGTGRVSAAASQQHDPQATAESRASSRGWQHDAVPVLHSALHAAQIQSESPHACCALETEVQPHSDQRVAPASDAEAPSSPSAPAVDIAINEFELVKSDVGPQTSVSHGWRPHADQPTMEAGHAATRLHCQPYMCRQHGRPEREVLEEDEHTACNLSLAWLSRENDRLTASANLSRWNGAGISLSGTRQQGQRPATSSSIGAPRTQLQRPSTSALPSHHLPSHSKSGCKVQLPQQFARPLSRIQTAPAAGILPPRAKSMRAIIVASQQQCPDVPARTKESIGVRPPSFCQVGTTAHDTMHFPGRSASASPHART